MTLAPQDKQLVAELVAAVKPQPEPVKRLRGCYVCGTGAGLASGDTSANGSLPLPLRGTGTSHSSASPEQLSIEDALEAA